MGETKSNILTRYIILKKAAVLLVTMLAIHATFANPTGGVVTSGSATITQTPGNTQINQTSDQAIINWQSFNIANGEKTQFNQPSSSSITLNRIDPGQSVSQIFGQLSANGRIILVNQAGIYFGPTARVDVGSIIASTSGITDQNFLAGKLIFDQTSALYHGTVINQGTIIAAQNGLVALVGSNVSNEGLIQANTGHVILASGNKFTVDLAGDGLINFAVDEASSASGVDQNGNAMRNGVNNSGTIIADGGTILMTGRTASGVVDNVINMSGVAQAHSVYQRHGEIILSAHSQGKVVVSGKLHASGKNSGQTGGTVKVLGGNVHLTSTAQIDVSGYNGGGTINIGGNFHGAGPDMNALTTQIDTGALLNANALMNGNGGNVSVWANLDTNFQGSITAQGGVSSGNGGFVETSGEYLNVLGGTVNTIALNGTMGTWLLDPVNITITSNSGTDSNASLSSGTYSPTSAANTSIIDVSNLVSGLSSSNITVTTTNSGTAGSSSGNITVASPIVWSSANTLTLSAANNIYLNADITAISGGLTLSAANHSQSITSGAVGAASATGVTANINVLNFNLSQGQWYQNGNSAGTTPGTLPTFNVTGNFQVASGAQAPTTAEFLRVAAGNGSANPYQLTDIFGVEGVNSRDTSGNNLLAKNFQLNNNISASTTSNWTWVSGTGFTPIGYPTQYSGTFNGQGFVISNLTMNYTSTAANQYVGFMANLIGVLENLGLTNINYSVSSTTGGTAYMGGAAGGLGSSASAKIINVYTTGTITSTANGSFGGIGGILGFNNNGTVRNSYSTVNITNSNGVSVLGGLVAVNGGAGIVTNSYASGTLSTTGTSSGSNFYLGGLVGVNSQTISNSYSTGNVSLTGSFASTSPVGGLVGLNQSSATINNSYSTGQPSSTSTYTGGLVGQNQNASTGVPATNFWDTTTSGLSANNGCGTGTCSALGQTTSSTMNYSTISGIFSSITSTPVTSGSPNYTWFMFNGSTRPILLSEEFYSITSNAASTTANLSIMNAHQLQLMGAALGESYNLGGNIDFSNVNTTDIWGSKFSATTSGAGFVPIGNVANNFTGSLTSSSGQYTINNLYINTTNYSAGGVGLFGTVGAAATINNIGLTNASITDTNTSAPTDGLGFGILAGNNAGTISNVFSTGSVTISRTLNASIANYAGGLIGNNTGSLSNLFSTATVSVSGTLTSGDLYAGGLIGATSGSMSNVYASGSVTNNSSVSNLGVGGLAGTITGGTTSDSYALGNVTSQGSASTAVYTGGLVGRITTGTLTRTYSNGSITATATGTNNTGGIVGSNTGTVGNTNYWNVTTSGIGSDGATTSGCGAGTCTATGESTTHMQTPSTFATWDFSTTPVWGILTNQNSSSASGLATNGSAQYTPYLNVLQQGLVIPTNFTSESISVASNGAAVTPQTSTSTGSSSVTYYVLLNRLGMSTTSPIIVYNTTGSNNFNAIAVPGTGTASNAIIFPTISANTIQIGGSTNAFYPATNYSSSISNTLLSTAVGNLGNASGILYSVSGSSSYSNLTLNSNISLISSAGTTYTMDGNITSPGSQTYNGAVILSGSPTLTSTGGNGITFSSTINGTNAGTQSLSIGNSSGAISFGGAIGGSTSLSSLTVGTNDSTTLSSNVTTSGAQTYNSNITLGAAANLIGTAITLGANTANSLINGGFNLTITNSLASTINAAISGSGSLTGAGSSTLTLNSANTYTGATTISSGTLQAGVANAFANSSGILISSGATFNLNNFNNSVSSISGTGNITLGSAALTVSSNSSPFSGVISGTGSLVKTGSGTLTLSGANTYLGGTQINAGTLVAANAAALGNTSSSVTIASGAELDVNGVALNANAITSNGGTIKGIGSASVAGNISLGSASTFTTSSNSDSLTFNGTVNGATNLTLAGNGNILIGGIMGGTTPLASLTSNSTTTTISTNITTSGAQTYNGAVSLSNNPILTVQNGDMTFAVGLSGNGTATSNSSGHTLSLQDSQNQTWNINASNPNTVSDGGTLSFNGFDSISGGSGSNNFIFANNASLNGTLNGGSTAANNTLNYSAYLSPVTINILGATNGNVANNNSQIITTFTNIGNATAPSGSTLVTANKNNNTIHITGGNAGYLVDPFSFNGISNITGQGNTYVIFDTTAQFNPETTIATIGSSSINFSGISPSNFSGNIMTVASSNTIAAISTVTSQTTNSASTAISDTLNDSQPQSIYTSDNSSSDNSNSTSSTTTVDNTNQIQSPTVTVNLNLNLMTKHQQQLMKALQQKQTFSGCGT